MSYELEYLSPHDSDLHLKISSILKEPNIKLLKKICLVLGGEFAIKVTQEVLNIQVTGGVSTIDGTRIRTAGGLFFSQIKKTIARDIVKYVFYERAKRDKLEAGFAKLTV